MRHTVAGFSQRKALEVKLQWQDLEILAWIKDFWPKMKKMIIKNEEYGWVNYSSLLKDVPIIDIKTPHGLYKRMKKIVDKGFLKHQSIKDKSGSFSYYKLTEKIMILLDDDYKEGGVVPMGMTRGSPDGDDHSPAGDNGSPEKDDPVIPAGTIKDPSTNNLLSISLNHIQDEGFLEIYEGWGFEEKRIYDALSKATLKEVELIAPEKDIVWLIEKYAPWVKKKSWPKNINAAFPAWVKSFLKKEKKEIPSKELAFTFKSKNLGSEKASPEVMINRMKHLLQFSLDHWEKFFAGKPIEETEKGWKIIVDDAEALQHKELFEEIKVKIEYAKPNK